MKIAGLFLLIAGFTIVVSAFLLLAASTGVRNLFVLAGLAVEILGMALLFRAHLSLAEER